MTNTDTFFGKSLINTIEEYEMEIKKLRLLNGMKPDVAELLYLDGIESNKILNGLVYLKGQGL